MQISDAAKKYHAAGLSVLPARRAEKRPTLPSWKTYRQRLPSDQEVQAWFANNPDALCVVCGAVSGHLEMLDFDQGGELFSPWCERVSAADPGLLSRLVIEGSPSGGWHVAYRCDVPVSGNLKLAQRQVDDGKIVTLIETRGEGGLFLCAPTPGYELLQGELTSLPVLSEQQRDTLLRCAWELNEYRSPIVDGPQASDTRPTTDGSPPDGLHGIDRPGDEFNRRGDLRALLERHGWTCVREGENQYWKRPGKKSGWSATLKDGVFYVFSANAEPFGQNQAYSPFAVYCLLEHGGDYEQAARALRQEGYGCDEASDVQHHGVDISGIVDQVARQAADDPSASEPLDIQPLRHLIDSFTGLNPPVIHGLLREGETMNIIASPKIGKSWFVSRLAISVASGIDWMGFAVEPGRVLHIDNELHRSTNTYRYRQISEAMNLSYRLYSDQIDLLSLRGQLRDLVALGELFTRLDAGHYKLVILDAFYRTLPAATDENDNAAIAGLYNRIDRYAAQLGCAFVLVHHASKGNQAGKSVTDVGAGAGSQSRAADTHLVLRPHEQPNLIVLESAVRSWPPIQPLALRWDWPLFHIEPDVDTSALAGLAKPSTTKAKEIPVEAFVERCIAINDPCSQRSVRYEAAQQYGLSERQANDLLDLAIERGLAVKIRAGSQIRYVANRPGATGEKGLHVAAILAHQPEADAQEVAEAVGVSERYVRQIRQVGRGTDAELGGTEFRK